MDSSKLYIDPTLSIDELQKQERLSVRTYNVCLRNNLDNLEKIIGHFLTHGNFLNLSNCGRKTDQQLSNVCRKYIGKTILKPEPKITPAPIAYSAKQEKLLATFLHNSIQKLSKRAQNVILKLLIDNGNSISKLLQYLKDIDYKYTLIKNTGRATSQELGICFTNLLQVSKLISKKEPGDIEYDLFILHMEPKLIKESSSLMAWLRDQREAFVSKRFPIFTLLEKLIEQNIITSDRKAYILKHYSDFSTKYKKYTLDKIGDKFGISRERARQLALPEKLIVPLTKEMKIIIDVFGAKNVNLERYEINTADNIIIPNFKHINYLENTNFSNSFIYKILSLLVSQPLIPCCSKPDKRLPLHLA